MLNYESVYETKRPPFPPEHCCQEEFRKEVTENAEVFLPVTIDPSVSIGKIKTESHGDPIVVCEKDECKHVCKLLITQKICVKIPLIYSVTVCASEDGIKCCTDKKPMCPTIG